MNLLDLPPEILLMIIKSLDLESQLRLYESCTLFQELVITLSIPVRRGNLKNSSIFQEKVFNAFSTIVKDINLATLIDITEKAKKSIRHMRNVTKIDFSYTNLYLEDIIFVCPEKVRHITLTLSVEDHNLLNDYNKLELLKIFFRKFDYVHFKYKPDFSDEDNPLFLNILKNPGRIRDMTVSFLSKRVLDADIEVIFGDVLPNFRKLQFNYNFLLPTSVSNSIYEFNINELEFFIYNFDQKEGRINIITSNLVRKILDDSKNITFKCRPINVLTITDLIDIKLICHVTYIVWNKRKIENGNISNCILKDVEKILPNHICIHANKKTKVITNVVNQNYFIHDCRSNENIDQALNISNIAKDFSSQYYKNVTIVNECVCGINIVCEEDELYSTVQIHKKNYLFPGLFPKYITFLTLHKINFSSESWFNLFSGCHSLHTMNVIVVESKSERTRNYLDIANNVRLCKSLRNFRLSEKGLNHLVLFEGLSRCCGLEIIESDCVFPVTLYGRNITNYNFILPLQDCTNLRFLVLDNLVRGDRMLREKFRQTLEGLALEVMKRDFNIILSQNAPYINYSSEKDCLTDVFYPKNRRLRN